jgi:hypothetical protein
MNSSAVVALAVSLGLTLTPQAPQQSTPPDSAYQPCAPMLSETMAKQQGEWIILSSPESHTRSLNDLVLDSTAIVVGRVTSQVCQIVTLHPQIRLVSSKYAVAVESSMLGSARGTTVQVRLPGGGRVVPQAR